MHVHVAGTQTWKGEHPSDVHLIKTDLAVPLVNIYLFFVVFMYYTGPGERVIRPSLVLPIWG